MHFIHITNGRLCLHFTVTNSYHCQNRETLAYSPFLYKVRQSNFRQTEEDVISNISGLVTKRYNKLGMIFENKIRPDGITHVSNGCESIDQWISQVEKVVFVGSVGDSGTHGEM